MWASDPPEATWVGQLARYETGVWRDLYAYDPIAASAGRNPWRVICSVRTDDLVIILSGVTLLDNEKVVQVGVEGRVGWMIVELLSQLWIVDAEDVAACRSSR